MPPFASTAQCGLTQVLEVQGAMSQPSPQVKFDAENRAKWMTRGFSSAFVALSAVAATLGEFGLFGDVPEYERLFEPLSEFLPVPSVELVVAIGAVALLLSAACFWVSLRASVATLRKLDF